MPEIQTLLILIPALPLAATLLTAVLGKRVLRSASHWPTVVTLAGSCAASILLVFAVERGAQQAAEGDASRQIGYAVTTAPLWNWAVVEKAYWYRGEGKTAAADQRATGVDGSVAAHPHPGPLPRGEGDLRSDSDVSPGWRDFQVDITLRADPLTAVMLATVTFISLLVAVYSIGYMHGDPGYWRFFTYIALFVFSMTMLVSVSNFLLLYVFWEAVGLCSYLLIGFWFQKPAAAAAGMKAFLVNRVGDFGFALGVFLLWTNYGTLNFHDTDVPGILGQIRLEHPELYVGGGVGTAICLLLMLGACGKSAQFPLHVWLPDAMEGPTPVSALIHAATMVTAGVYMVARCSPLLLAAPDAQHTVAAVGGITAVLGAVIALTQTDLKRILAYSTISQLGYMFLGLGAGTFLGITAGMFHLVTHAFFKALLFLGAGSVMHAMGGVIDIRQFGGLRRRLPTTHVTFLCGCLALAGIVPFAGFWSKDSILLALQQNAARGSAMMLYEVLYLAALVTAFLTAVYTFRAYFLTFHGPERIPKEAGHHAHESPPSMTVPLMILALGALGVGGYFEWTHDFTSAHGYLGQTPSLAYVEHHGPQLDAAEGESHHLVAIVSSVIAVAGVAVAAVLYLGPPRRAKAVANLMQTLGLYSLSYGKFFFDPLYRLMVVWPLEAFARLCAWVDRYVIDGLVNAVGMLPMVVGAVLRPLQGGIVQFYALVMVLGLLALLGALLM